VVFDCIPFISDTISNDVTSMSGLITLWNKIQRMTNISPYPSGCQISAFRQVLVVDQYEGELDDWNKHGRTFETCLQEGTTGRADMPVHGNVGVFLKRVKDIVTQK
jgi:hypothetical protein